ncbi:hypothetical protein KSP40_PGU003768 [Platanthera guangdongensis]|uniref:Uncharacterized protein n=1 Tax=Platanthera guangdongensis TaxID=2320717 RepID=A0ABR2MAM0_9ASPA
MERALRSFEDTKEEAKEEDAQKAAARNVERKVSRNALALAMKFSSSKQALDMLERGIEQLSVQANAIMQTNYITDMILATDEKYNEAMITAANRLVAAIDGLPDPGGPTFKDNKRESNFKSKEGTDEKSGQFSIVVGGLLGIAFVVPMAQYYAFVSKK